MAQKKANVTQGQQAKRAICFLPSGEMLRRHGVEHWLKRFSEFTSRSATEVVLPAVGFSGPLYDSQVHPFPKTLERSNLLPQWVRQAREQLGDSGTVWALINVDCGFLENEALWLRNQYDQELDQACIVNSVVQDILRDFIVEIQQFGVNGIVLDVTDAYPNSGSDAYEGIMANCFCDYCLDGLREKGFRELKEAFVGGRGLLRLVLHLEEDEGASHIDPLHEWIEQRNTGALVTLALARRFVEGDRNELEADAGRLLQYFAARTQLNADAIRKVLVPCRDSNLRTAVVLGSAAADLSQMVTLQSLHAAQSACEYWLPDGPARNRFAAEWQGAQFLAGRSTYYFNAFFEVVEDAKERLILQGVEGFLASLLRVSKNLMGNKLNPGAAYTVGKLEQFSGFVGVPLGQQEHLEIIDHLTREVTGTVLPAEMLQRFRISSPDRSE